jgi:hypothetical protein
MKQEVNGGFFNEVIDKCKLVIAQFTYWSISISADLDYCKCAR